MDLTLPRTENRAVMNHELGSFLAALARTPSADNSQPWMFSIRHHSLHCDSSPASMGGPVAVMTAHSQLMTGGAMHEAMSAQLDEPVIRCAISPEQGNAWSLSVEIAAIGRHWRKSAHEALLQRHTNRLAYRKDPVRWRPPASGFDEDIQLHLIEPGEEQRLIARSVEQSAQARFQCRELHEWLHDSLRWTDAQARRGDGLDIRTLGLPYPARTLLHFLAPWSRQRRLPSAPMGRLSSSPGHARMTCARTATIAPAATTISRAQWTRRVGGLTESAQSAQLKHREPGTALSIGQRGRMP